MANDMSAVLQSLIDKLKKRGHSQDDILKVVQSEGDGLLEKFADVMSAAATKPRETFPVEVNYSLTVEAAISAGNYQGVNAGITSKNFPPSRKGQVSLEIQLVRYDRRMSSESVLEELESDSLRPAELSEFLAFGATYPEVQRRFSVVGLGSVWRDRKGYRNVPCLYTASEGRYLDLHWWDDGWYSYSRFAAIRK